MWCIECQQDVPGVVSSRGDGRLCCSRCGDELPSAGSPVQDEPWDDWDLEAELRELDAITGPLPVDEPRQAPVADHAASVRRTDTVRRIDATHASAESSPPVTSVATPRMPRATGAWILVLLGTAIGMSGAVLTGWAIVLSQPLLWKVGLAVAAGGVLVLQAGGILLLDHAAQARRQMHHQLQAIHTHLQQLEKPRSGTPAPHEPATILAAIRQQLETLEP